MHLPNFSLLASYSNVEEIYCIKVNVGDDNVLALYTQWLICRNFFLLTAVSKKQVFTVILLVK